jgi:hypothetical protein
MTLEADVAAKLADCASRLKRPTKDVVNSALRIGLDQLTKPIQPKPYQTVPRALGARLQGHSVAEWLEAADQMGPS